jgi:hypothetical protein
MVRERGLERMELPAIARHALDGLDHGPVALEAEHEAGEDGLSVEDHRARAALPELAAVLRAGQSELLPQDLEERLAGREGHLHGIPVHRHRHRGQAHGRSPLTRYVP